MRNLTELRSEVKTVNKGYTVKTNGDFCSISKGKLYAIYLKNERLTAFYSVSEWTPFKLSNALKALNQ